MQNPIDSNPTQIQTEDVYHLFNDDDFRIAVLMGIITFSIGHIFIFHFAIYSNLGLRWDYTAMIIILQVLNLIVFISARQALSITNFILLGLCFFNYVVYILITNLYVSVYVDGFQPEVDCNQFDFRSVTYCQDITTQGEGLLISSRVFSALITLLVCCIWSWHLQRKQKSQHFGLSPFKYIELNLNMLLIVLFTSQVSSYNSSIPNSSDSDWINCAEALNGTYKVQITACGVSILATFLNRLEGRILQYGVLVAASLMQIYIAVYCINMRLNFYLESCVLLIIDLLMLRIASVSINRFTIVKI